MSGEDDPDGYLRTDKPCRNYAVVALLLMPYALIRYGIDCLRGRP